MFRKSYTGTQHITLARSLHARLYVNVEGRIFAVGGHVAYPKLALALARQDRRPTAAEAPTPSDLGISTSDGELSQHLLYCIGRALKRWRKELDAEMRRRPAMRRRAVQLDRDHQEIERLQVRLGTVRAWHEELSSGGEPPGAPYFLDSSAELAVQVTLQESGKDRRLPPLILWQARLVYWLAGDCAMRRYLAAVTGLLEDYPAASPREHIRGFQRAVLAWKQRAKQEQIRHLLAEIAAHIQRLPPDVVRQGKLSSRLRGRTFDEHCDHLLERCTQLLLTDQLHRWHKVPAALAALAASDGSQVPLPRRCFEDSAKQEDFAGLLRTIGKLAEEIGQPGYGALLAAIDQLPQTPHEFEYCQLRQLLAQGNSVSDAAWACQQELLHGLKHSCLNIAAARRLSAEFAKRGCPLNTDDLAQLVSSIRQKKHLAPIEAWLGWLGVVSRQTITPRMRNVLQGTFWQRYLPCVQRHGWFEQLAPYVAVRRSQDPYDASSLLERIASYQQLAGKKVSPPKSLRKLLEFHDRGQQELDHLRSRLADGQLGAAAQRRLEFLENTERPQVRAAKLRRAAEEVYLLLGIEAQAAIAQRLAEAKCREHLGDLARLLEPDQFWDFALWIETMSDLERQRLRLVIATRDQFGPSYKRHLAENQEWIAKAVGRGVNLEPWLAAEPNPVMIDGQLREIGIANDLHNIFLMGEYFDTCLSLGNSNEMAVLTNAYDANKQVVFMFARDDAGRRQVVARQLIAVSSEFTLLGYCCYTSWTEKERRQKAQQTMASYCGRLAAQCGLELADQGSPETIGDHFWYDDGECEWPAAARTAWAEHAK